MNRNDQRGTWGDDTREEILARSPALRAAERTARHARIFVGSILVLGAVALVVAMIVL